MMRGPGPRGRGDGRKAKDVKGTLKRLLSYVAQYKVRLLLVMQEETQSPVRLVKKA